MPNQWVQTWIAAVGRRLKQTTVLIVPESIYYFMNIICNNYSGKIKAGQRMQAIGEALPGTAGL